MNGIPVRRTVRILFLIGVFLLLATIVPPRPSTLPIGPSNALLTATPIALDADSPGRRRVGRLMFLRGWHLTSDDPRFGAISAMHVESGRVIALSDSGNLFRFDLPRPAGAQPLRVAPLPFAPGTLKRNRDTESLVVRGPDLWIGFERLNAIRHYRDGREQGAAHPARMRRWGRNSGAEAMVRLADGRFLIFAEGRDDDAAFSPVLLFEGDPSRPGTRSTEMRYRRLPGFRVTDAALLPDGQLMILNRRFSYTGGFAAALVVAERGAFRPGATIVGSEVASLPESMLGENLEALSVTRENGRTILRLASDDNFMPILRTVLLEFAFDEGDGPT